MRLDEIIKPPTKVVVTEKFLENYEKFRKTNPSLVSKKFKYFIEAKLSGADAGDGDSAFTGNPEMLTYRKFYLIFGRAAIIYKHHKDELRLYTVEVHSFYDRYATLNAFARWADDLPDSKLITIDPTTLYKSESSEIPVLSPDEKEKVDSIIYELIASGGLEILKLAIVRNNWDDFFDWLRYDIPDVNPEAVFRTYSGLDELKNFILTNIAQFGKTAEYQNITLS